MVWNIAGLRNCDRDTWRYIKQYDVIGLTETWIDKENVEIKRQLDDKFVWKMKMAKKEKKKGRASGGMLVGVKKHLISEIRWLNEEVAKVAIKNVDECLDIYMVYMGKDKQKNREALEDEIEKEPNVSKIIVGDFNARIGKEVGTSVLGVDVRRKSKDVEINGEGKALLEWIEENGLIILNGNMEGDEEGEFTYVSNGTTVIDFALADRDTYERIEKFTVGERADSDHMPLEIKLRGNYLQRSVIREGNCKKYKKIIDLSEKGMLKFKKNIENYETNKKLDCANWSEFIQGIKEAVVYKNIEEKEEQHDMWWDEECKRTKDEIMKEVKKWKCGRGNTSDIKKCRREHKNMVKKKRKEYLDNWVKEMMSQENEGGFWKIISKSSKRKTREKTAEKIKKEDWLNHFMEVFEGNSEKKGKSMERAIYRHEFITMQEIKKSIADLKKKKLRGRME